MTSKMIWHADSKESYIHPPYKICWTTMGYELWVTGKRCLGRRMSISEAMAAADRDKQSTSGAEHG